MTDKLPDIFCALDTDDLDHAMAMAAAMQRAECGLKIGLQFFNAHGPEGVREISKTYPDTPLFLDFKYHDIPNTVAGAVHAITVLAPDYINVHAGGGLAMMQAAKAAAVAAAEEYGVKCPGILGVTLLTSLDVPALAEIGMVDNVKDQVIKLAKLTQKAGLDGVVCSGLEIEGVRAACGDDFVLMVPGIRPEGAGANDQKRTMTPAQALEKGATHLVIGRAITGTDDPATAASRILEDIARLKAA